MKPVLAALACASLIATPIAAAAQHHGGGGGGGGGGFHGGGGGGGHWGGGGGWNGGGWSGGSWGGGFHGHGFHGHGCWGCFGGFAYGLALGAAWYPWYWDGYYGPWYGSYGYTVVYADDGYYYDRYQRQYDGAAAPQAAPPPTYAAPAAPACGQWLWDAAGQQYHWIPCAAPAPPPR